MELITLSVNDAATALSVSRSTAYELINTGRLHAIKLGRRTLVTVESIKALIANAEKVGDLAWEKVA